MRVWELSYLNNPLSKLGIVLFVGLGLLHFGLFNLDLWHGIENTNLRILFHFILPPSVVLGATVAVLGAVRARRRPLLNGAPPLPFILPFTRPLALLGLFTALLAPFLTFSGYSGHSFGSSSEFCATACHAPLAPQVATFAESAHSSIRCTECHIGDGLRWIMRSKVSGVREVLSTLFDSYERPIVAGPHSIPSAEETCLVCHRADRHPRSAVSSRSHFGFDQHNTERTWVLEIEPRTRSENPSGSAATATRDSHCHTAPGNRVEFVVTDEERGTIPWVRIESLGKTRVYRSDGLDHDAPPPPGEIRIMGCRDCHNRTSHDLKTAEEIVDDLLAKRLVDPSLPYFKREGSRILSLQFPDSSTARDSIDRELSAFYEENFPQVFERRRDAIGTAASRLQSSIGKHIFPEMGVNGRTYSDHLGHLVSPGCFRCHDGEHRASNGSVLSQDCNLCHQILDPSSAEPRPVLTLSDYNHPFPLRGAHEDVACVSCHSSPPPLSSECADCHHEIRDFIAGNLPLLPGLPRIPSPKSEFVACVDCHEESKRIPRTSAPELCVECHDDEYLVLGKNQIATVEEALRRARQSARSDETLRKAIDSLDRVGPLHNVESSLEVLRRIESANSRR